MAAAHMQMCVEESPGSTETRWRITSAGGDPRESATENKPPTGFGFRIEAAVRVKRCGKSAPRMWQHRRHGKPHREQDQIGMAHDPFPDRHPGRSREAFGNERPRGMVIQSWQHDGQNPAYRPSDANFSISTQTTQLSWPANAGHPVEIWAISQCSGNSCLFGSHRGTQPGWPAFAGHDSFIWEKLYAG